MELTINFIRLFGIAIYLVAPLLGFLASIIIVLGQIVTRIEKWDRWDGLYWSFITATTVGYGDIRPLQKRAKALAVVIALVGMMFTGIIVAVTVNTVVIVMEHYLDPAII